MPRHAHTPQFNWYCGFLIPIAFAGGSFILVALASYYANKDRPEYHGDDSQLTQASVTVGGLAAFVIFLLSSIIINKEYFTSVCCESELSTPDSLDESLLGDIYDIEEYSITHREPLETTLSNFCADSADTVDDNGDPELFSASSSAPQSSSIVFNSAAASAMSMEEDGPRVYTPDPT